MIKKEFDHLPKIKEMKRAPHHEVKKTNYPKVLLFVIAIALLSVSITSCKKDNDLINDQTNAPLAKNYTITSSLDNLGLKTSSKATGSLIGSYDNTTKVFFYSLTFTGINPLSVSIYKNDKSITTPAFDLAANNGLNYTSPVDGHVTLTASQETDLLAGLWFVKINTDNFKSGEISGNLSAVQK